MCAELTPKLRRVHFTSADTDEAEAFLTELRRTPVRLTGLLPGRPLRHHVVSTPEVAFSKVDYPPLLEVDIEPLPSVVVVEVLSGQMERQTRGESTVFPAGSLSMFARPAEAIRSIARDASIRSTTINAAALSTLVSGPAGDPLIFTDRDPVSASAATVWQRTAAYVRRLLANPEIDIQPLVMDAAIRVLAAATISTFPNTWPQSPGALDRRDAHPAVLRRAISFIETNPAEPITVTQIAEAAGASARAVQIAFRRHLDTTPMAYLRRVRLAGAHEELLARDPQTTTVAEIAAQWGFPDQSRFTGAYRSSYGCTPGQTLRGDTAP